MRFSINKTVEGILSRNKGASSFKFTDDNVISRYEKEYGDIYEYSSKVHDGIKKAGYKISKIKHEYFEAYGALGQLYLATL